MPDTWLSDTRASYDVDAHGYAKKVNGLLAQNPYLRGCLALFAELVQQAGGGPVADVGCGLRQVRAEVKGRERVLTPAGPESQTQPVFCRREDPRCCVVVAEPAGLGRRERIFADSDDLLLATAPSDAAEGPLVARRQ